MASYESRPFESDQSTVALRWGRDDENDDDPDNDWKSAIDMSCASGLMGTLGVRG
jgi:hypothetical protein